jgi:type III restriction enzyme
MPEPFLYETLDAVSRMSLLKREVPHNVTLNLNPRYELRHYQIEAFARFLHCHSNEFPGKTYPLHFLFNMATGSGKTLIMAGLILYLYEQGYRNFLFFVNSTNIIEKTKDNFLNPASIKFLFNQEIVIGSRRVRVGPVDNFEAMNPNDINICFTTIQKLHSDLTTEKENALTFEDFRKHKIALIADEAHHMNVKTKSQQEMFESWENTVERIFTQNEDNLLLEFTATHDYETPAMVEKYRNKVIIRYDLLQFRNDRYSKDVVIVQSDFKLNERILQALLLSQYKKEVAAMYRINLKPVILFKAQRTIEQSKENKTNFHQLIERLSANDIAALRKSDLPIVRRAFAFFQAEGITDEQLAERLRREFHPDYCLSVNEETEKENYQILVNTLEDHNNRIRAIFAVQKLNEGWDVLNLFDIVRCYEARDTGRAKIGATTMSEAQLIGRGARYFPFSLPESDDRFRRKFDGDLEHELRVLEELHYHSINDSRYISELRTALIQEGIIDDREIERELKLKESFKESDFYRSGIIYINERLKNTYEHVRSFSDLGVSRRNYSYKIATGRGAADALLVDERNPNIVREAGRRDVKIKDISIHIVRSALARNPFYNFGNLKRYFPSIKSVSDLIHSDCYLADLEITFQGEASDLYNISNRAQLEAVIGLLAQIESEIRKNITEFIGTSNFKANSLSQIFHNKVLKLNKSSEKARGDEEFVSDKEWYVFNANYGTQEEKAFVRMLERQMANLRQKYDGIYLIRNERHFKLYDFRDGKGFEPDFVLFLQEKNGSLLTYQLFIEPKGRYLKEHEKWKEQFLNEIKTQFKGKVLQFNERLKYRVIGVPFYNNEDENKFRESLYEALEV